uniref:FYVE, RhoGEF and PH domain containing 3 n=2 Tax=Sus scrofa TaxID=9823 RepID=A0A8D1IWC3_PIG
MEPGGGSSMPPAPIAALGEPDAGPSSSSLELPSTDPGKLQALPVGPGVHCGDPASGSPDSQVSVGDSPQDMGSIGEPSSSTKIPNRDSGIDSPSCSVVSEHFPCEEGSEAAPGPTIKGLHPETASEGTTPREEADSDVGEGSSEEPEAENSRPRADADPAKCSKPQKLLHIAQELLHTEETYVKRLHLLDQVFCTQLTEAGIPSEVTTGIFSNISSIYRFHGQFLLPELQTRITTEWDTNPRLGDILQKLAPFLKMYGEYVKNFDRAVELVSTWTQRSPLFKDIVQGIQKMHKLLEVYERLGGEEDIVNPANELIKEGHIQKLSAKNGTAQDRHLFLFNSMILYCVPKLRLMGQKFSVREKMDISGLQVQDSIKPNSAHTFIITGKKRSLELQTRTEEEKKEWIQVIEATIEKHKQNSQTFKAFSGSFGQDEDSSFTADPPMVNTSSEVPAVVASGGGGAAGLEPRRASSRTRRDKEKQGCRSCGETFNSITKRKHHCKLCGAVICGKCSEFKAENGRQSRVCRECFLTQPAAPLNPSPDVPLEPKQSTEKPAAVDHPPSLLCGPLQVSDGSTAWSKVWAAIPESGPPELVLRLHGGSQDGQLLCAIPLSGCRVSVPDPADRLDARHMWRLQQGQQCWCLSAPSVELQQQWLEALSMAARRPPALAAP